MDTKIVGYKKTKKDFLEKIRSISNDMSKLKDNLSKLNIFSYINLGNKKIAVIENKNKFSLMSKGKDRNYVNFTLSNIFGKGENLTLDINSIKEYELCVSKPLIFQNSLIFANVLNKKTVTKVLDKEHIIDKKEVSMKCDNFEIGYGWQKYVFLRCNHPILNLTINCGIDYIKIVSLLDVKHSITRNIKCKLTLETGVAMGKVNELDMFYLGKNIKGYKNDSITPCFNYAKTGGKSFVSVTGKIIYDLKLLSFYFFNSFCCNNLNSNTLDIFNPKKDKIRAMGQSVGFGFTVPLSEKLANTFMNISIAFPLIKNEDTEFYQFSCDFNF